MKYLNKCLVQAFLFHTFIDSRFASFSLSLFSRYFHFIFPLFQNQYAFIYDALLEAVIVGDTEIGVKDLSARISDLERINPETNKSLLVEEFEVCILQCKTVRQITVTLLPKFFRISLYVTDSK